MVFCRRLGRRLIGLDPAPPEDPCTGRPKTAQIGPGLAGGRNVWICIRDLYETREGSGTGPNRPFSRPRTGRVPDLSDDYFCRTSAVKLRVAICSEVFALIYLPRSVASSLLVFVGIRMRFPSRRFLVTIMSFRIVVSRGRFRNLSFRDRVEDEIENS